MFKQRLKKVLEKQEFESQIRDKYPAVKNAFEQYKTIARNSKALCEGTIFRKRKLSEKTRNTTINCEN